MLTTYIIVLRNSCQGVKCNSQISDQWQPERTGLLQGLNETRSPVGRFKYMAHNGIFAAILLHRKKRITSFPSLFPPRKSLVVTSRLGTGNSRTFFLRCSFLDMSWFIASSLECKKLFLEPCVWSQTCRQVTEVFLNHFYLYTVTKPEV